MIVDLRSDIIRHCAQWISQSPDPRNRPRARAF